MSSSGFYSRPQNLIGEHPDDRHPDACRREGCRLAYHRDEIREDLAALRTNLGYAVGSLDGILALSPAEALDELYPAGDTWGEVLRGLAAEADEINR